MSRFDGRQQPALVAISAALAGGLASLGRRDISWLPSIGWIGGIAVWLVLTSLIYWWFGRLAPLQAAAEGLDSDGDTNP